MVETTEGDAASLGVPPCTDMVALADEVVVDSYDDEGASEGIEETVILAL